MNSYEIKICSEATFIWSLSPLNIYVCFSNINNFAKHVEILFLNSEADTHY